MNTALFLLVNIIIITKNLGLEKGGKGGQEKRGQGKGGLNIVVTIKKILNLTSGLAESMDNGPKNHLFCAAETSSSVNGNFILFFIFFSKGCRILYIIFLHVYSV
jgi:hypothetical protein